MQQVPFFSRRSQAGFTLVEISIVLIILGLLLGGVLRGSEIIENARVRNLYDSFTDLSTAIYGYQDRYGAIPGDDPLGAARGFSNTPVTAVSGNGNGFIENAAWCPASSGVESCQALYHLRQAGYITGTGTLAPNNAFGTRVLVARTSGLVAGPDRPVAVCYENLDNKVARALDQKYDDNVSSSGAVRGNGDYVAGSNGSVSSPVTCINTN